MNIHDSCLADNAEAIEIDREIKCHEQNMRDLLRAMRDHDEPTRQRAQKTINNLERQLHELREVLLIMSTGGRRG
jgi:1,2-phenylacetyl-CoA epoxidase catalytic subunit